MAGQQAEDLRFGDSVAARIDLQFLTDVQNVPLGGVGRDEQAGCDLFIAETLRQQFEDFEFASGQRLDQLRRRLGSS